MLPPSAAGAPRLTEESGSRTVPAACLVCSGNAKPPVAPNTRPLPDLGLCFYWFCSLDSHFLINSPFSSPLSRPFLSQSLWPRPLGQGPMSASITEVTTLY